MQFKTYKQKNSIMDSQLKYKCQGKVLFEIKEMIMSKITDSTYFIRLSHETIQISTSKIMQKKQQKNLNWSQKIYLPIFNNYGTIKFELVKCTLSGWIKENEKE